MIVAGFVSLTPVRFPAALQVLVFSSCCVNTAEHGWRRDGKRDTLALWPKTDLGGDVNKNSLEWELSMCIVIDLKTLPGVEPPAVHAFTLLSCASLSEDVQQKLSAKPFCIQVCYCCHFHWINVMFSPVCLHGFVVEGQQHNCVSKEFSWIGDL